MRFEKRIRELCAKVVAASDTEFQSAIAELKKALRDHKTAPNDPEKRQSKPKIVV
jgi:hypothetical protein